MELKVKLLETGAKLPEYAKAGDAAMDLYATSKTWDEENQVLIFGTGLAVEIPKGYVGLLFPRSSVYKTGLSLCNAVGVIDSGFRNEIKVLYYPGNRPKQNYEVGERVGQLMLVEIPYMNIRQVEELDTKNDRGGGLGSTGR